MSQRTLVSRKSSKKNAAAGSDPGRTPDSGQCIDIAAPSVNLSAAKPEPADLAPGVSEITCEQNSSDESVNAIAEAHADDRDVPCELFAGPSVEQSEFSVTEIEPAMPVSGTSNDETLIALNDELARLGEILRQEFRKSVAELQASHTAAVKAQSEVLRTLTDVVFQASAPREISRESLERALSGVENRLISRIEAIQKSSPSKESLPSGNAEHRASNAANPKSQVELRNAASSVHRSWEQIRSEFVENGELSDPPSGQALQSSEELQAVTQLSSSRHFRLPEQDLALEIPKTLDPESASEEELRHAFRERESFISTLISRVRRQQETATGQLSSEQLRTLVTHLPEGLAEQVRHTLKQMDDLARMGELELSMERARISRQINQLEHAKQILENNARQLGWEVNPDGSVSPPAKQQGRTSSGSRRWLSQLGFGQ